MAGVNCPTCRHEMKTLGTYEQWCPRCGTHVANPEHPDFECVSMPALVGQCRAFHEEFPELTKGAPGQTWTRLGIAAAIGQPGEARA
jgi:hypothetical protein